MEEKTWKMAQWHPSWDAFDDPKKERYGALGICQFSESNGILLEIPLGKISRTKELQETECWGLPYKHLYGITQNGDYLVLNDARSVKTEERTSGGPCQNLRAETILSSRSEFNPDAPIIAANFKIEGIHKWVSAVYRLNTQGDPSEIKCPTEYIPFEAYHSNKYTMTIRHGIEKKCSHVSINISTYTEVHIHYTNGVSLDDFWTGELCRFRAFLAFCFGACPAIQQVQVTFTNNNNRVDVYKSTAPTKKIREDFKHVPVPFSLVEENLSKVVTQWMEMTDDEARSSEMLTSLLGSWEMPLDLQLFAVSSMLESLARSRCVKKHSYRELLNIAYKESKTWVAEIVPNWKEFKKEQIQLRNAGAHALGNGGEYEKMTDHYYAQILIAYVIIMKRLGLDDALERFMKSPFLCALSQQIRKRYPKPTSQQ